MNTDPRLLGRQKFLLEQTKALLEMLQGNTENIDWELVARLGCEIQATAKTAKTLVIKQSITIKK